MGPIFDRDGNAVGEGSAIDLDDVQRSKLDKKFAGTIYKVKDGSIVPGDEYVVFLAKDNAFAEILPMYLTACLEMHCDQEQIQAVSALIDRVDKWRREHPERLKNPDAAGERLLP
jgi:hypothetical protein